MIVVFSIFYLDITSIRMNSAYNSEKTTEKTNFVALIKSCFCDLDLNKNRYKFFKPVLSISLRFKRLPRKPKITPSYEKPLATTTRTYFSHP